MNLLEGFFKFIKKNQLPLGEAAPALLAVSGGLDSVVMAHLFREANFPFAIAHGNFQLRGGESDSDEHFVQKLASDFGVPFFVKRFETKTYAKQRGLSTQMAARDLRYEWFDQIAEENDFATIATAHHLNDSVETALLNFVRGTALAGLSGIAPKSGLLLRPLLFASRNEILEYAQTHKLAWREDSSNASDDYARNFVRHHIVPRLEELNPNFLRTAKRNMERIGEAQENLAFLLAHCFFEEGEAPVLIDGVTESHPVNNRRLALLKQKLAELPAPQQALRQLLKPYGFDAEQARQVAANLDHVGLELRSEKGFQLLVDREKILVVPSAEVSQGKSPIIFTRRSFNEGGHHSSFLPAEVLAKVGIIHHSSFIIQPDDLMLSLPDGSRLFLMAADPAPPFPDGRCAVLVDAGCLKFPLLLRPWLPGDSFQPFGMGGQHQKLQDFFTNQKLSRLEKEHVWLLLNGDGEVIWVVGWRLDERFKIHSNTKKALKINWIK